MPNLQQIITLIESKRKHNFPWKREQPYSQPYFHHNKDSNLWEDKHGLPDGVCQTQSLKDFEILSWNIDFMLPFTSERMQVALEHLGIKVSASNVPSIILLNECLVSDLTLIQSQPWIQHGFYITDVDDQYWESGHYGTCSLVPKTMTIKNVFRVHYEATKMERDALCVDIDVGDGKILRVGNSHLESLVAEPPVRPKQLETAAKYIHDPEVHASAIGGDFNAIQPFDRTLHSENGLKDAYLEMGGREDSDEGYTWGQMAPVKQREMFGCSRMDKLFFYGGIKVERFERFGLGVKVDDEQIEKVLREEEGLDGPWVTDHAGIKGLFRVVDAPEGGAPGSKI